MMNYVVYIIVMYIIQNLWKARSAVITYFFLVLLLLLSLFVIVTVGNYSQTDVKYRSFCLLIEI